MNEDTLDVSHTPDHIYTYLEADVILDAFPDEILIELLELATRAEEMLRDSDSKHIPENISLPPGWDMGIFGNCITVAYKDGEQCRRKFYVPVIWINYMEYVNDENPRVTKKINERLPLGYCSCGKAIRILQWLLKAKDLSERKGRLCFIPKTIAWCMGLCVGLYVRSRPIDQYSLMFNRHRDCL